MSMGVRTIMFGVLFYSQTALAFDWCGTLFFSRGTTQSNYMVVDGTLRSYSLYVPPEPVFDSPMLIDFHGFGANSLSESQSSCWRKTAAREGAVVAYPQGKSLIPAWGAGDYCCLGGSENDTAFALMLASCLTRTSVRQWGLKIDASRIYGVGLSNGGAMAGRLACEHSDVFAGAVVTSQSFPFESSEQCRSTDVRGQQKRAVPVLEARGTVDVIVPYVYSWGWSVPATESLNRWQRAMGCQGPSFYQDICDRPGSGPDCEYGFSWCETYQGCDGGAVVSQCTLIDGHLLYKNNQDYNVCDDGWFMLEQFELMNQDE